MSIGDKQKNREQFNRRIGAFCNKSFIPEISYHLGTKSIKSAKFNSPKTYEQVTSFVDKNYINNKNKIAMDKYLEEARKEIFSFSEQAPADKFEKIEKNLDNKLNVYSDDFGANLKKTLKHEVEEKDVFRQLVFNLTMAEVVKDFLKLGLSANEIKIKDETIKSNKDDKAKSV